MSMFGLDKIFGGSGLLGKFFDSIGMSWMSNVISLAANVMTGNWLAAAGDVFNLVSQFSNNNSWMSRVSQQPPLGPFASDGCFKRGVMSESRADELRTQVSADDPRVVRNSTRAIFIAHETRYNNTVANQNLREAFAQQRI